VLSPARDVKWALLSTYLVTPGSEAGALAGAPPRHGFSGARASLAGRQGRSWSEQQRAGCATDHRGVGRREPRMARLTNVQVYLTGVIKPNTPGHIGSARGMGRRPRHGARRSLFCVQIPMSRADPQVTGSD
jgi:hypothetical protein